MCGDTRIIIDPFDQINKSQPINFINRIKEVTLLINLHKFFILYKNQ
jgi:hypothetical protein